MYESSSLCQDNDSALHVAMQPAGDRPMAQHLYQAPLWAQFRVLFRKWLLLHWRSPSYNVSRLVTCVLIACIMGSIFWQITGSDQQSVFTRFALQFMALIFMGIVFANTIQGVVAAERPVFYREWAAHMYRPYVLNVVAGLCEVSLHRPV